MRKILNIFLTITIFLTLTGCSQAQNPAPTQPPITFSNNILLSINNGTAGDGTIAECTDATIIIYKDRTVKVHMHVKDFPEIGSVLLSEEDYNAIAELASPEEIASYQVTDGEGCDGSSYYISLYDENDKEAIIKGGYMAVGEEFGATYRAIHEILAKYEIKEIVNEYRATM